MSALVGALRAMLTLDSTAFVDGAKKAQKSQKGLQSSLKGMQDEMLKLSAVMAAVGVALGAALRGPINDADMLGEMAEKIGVPVEELSRLKYAAEITGVPLATLETSLEQLSKRMVAAAEGGKVQTQMFADLGVAVVDAEGQMRSTEAVLQDLAGAFADMPDGAEKTALAMEVFGKAGADMILMLNQGKDGLASLSAEAERFGVVVTPEMTKAAGEFNENLDKLKAASYGLRMQLAEELLPVLKVFSDWAIDAANGFASLDPVIKKQLHDAFVTLGGAVAGAFELMGMAMAKFHEAFVLVGGAVAGSVELLVIGFEKISGVAIEFGLALEQEVTARVQALINVFEGLISVAKRVSEAIADAMSYSPDEIQGATENEQFNSGIDSFSSNSFSSNSRSTGVEGANGLIEGFRDTLAARMAEIAAMADQITTTVRQQWDVQSPSRVFREIGQFLTEGLSLGIADNVPMVDAAMDEVTESIDGAGGLKDSVESMKSTLSGAFTGLVTGAMSFSEALSQVLSKLAEMLAQAAFDGLMAGGGNTLLTGIMSAFGFADGAAFDGGKVTAFATGGIVDGATAFGMQGGLGVMGEAGPEAIMPLTRIGGKLGVLAEGGGARVRLEIAEGEMFAARVQTIADDRAVQVTRTYDREVAPQTNRRPRRERG